MRGGGLTIPGWYLEKQTTENPAGFQAAGTMPLKGLHVLGIKGAKCPPPLMNLRHPGHREGDFTLTLIFILGNAAPE